MMAWMSLALRPGSDVWPRLEGPPSTTVSTVLDELEVSFEPWRSPPSLSANVVVVVGPASAALETDEELWSGVPLAPFGACAPSAAGLLPPQATTRNAAAHTEERLAKR